MEVFEGSPGKAERVLAYRDRSYRRADRVWLGDKTEFVSGKQSGLGRRPERQIPSCWWSEPAMSLNCFRAIHLFDRTRGYRPVASTRGRCWRRAHEDSTEVLQRSLEGSDAMSPRGRTDWFTKPRLPNGTPNSVLVGRMASKLMTNEGLPVYSKQTQW